MRIAKLAVLQNKHVMALIGNLVIAVLGVASMSLLLHTLSKPDAGTWFFFLSIYNLSDSVRTGFLQTGTIKFYAGTLKERGNEVLGSVWFLALAVSLSLMLINVCAMPFIGMIQSQQVILVIKWFGLTVLSSVTFNITFWTLVAEENYLVILWMRLINNGTMMLAIIVAAYMGKATLENLLIINFATNVLTSAACIIFGYSHIGTIFKRTRKTMLELVHFGKYSMATSLSSNLLGSVNTFIIAPTLGPIALAVYNVPNKLMEIMEILLRTFVGTGMSTMATAYNNNDLPYLTYISKKYAGMLTWLFIPLAVGAFFLADFAIWLLAGDKYAGTEAANIFRIFMVIAIIYPIDRFNGVTLDIIHKPQINFYKVIIMVIVNATATSVGLYFFRNVYGAALSAPFCVVAGLAFGYYHLKRNLDGYSLRGILSTGWVEGIALIKEGLGKLSRAKA